MIAAAIISVVLVALAGPALLAVVVIRRFAERGTQGPISGNSVRRFFQYILMYGLLVISGTGLYGLLGRLIRGANLLSSDQATLARNFSFIVVGIPLYIILAMWTRRKFEEDPKEAETIGWSFYITASSITALLIIFFGLRDFLTWAIVSSRYDSQSIARVIVWGAIWSGHWMLDSRVTPALSSRYHHILGSFIGFVAIFVGLSDLLAVAIGRVFHLGGETIFSPGGDSIWQGTITLIVGVPVWYVYWIRTYSKSQKDSLWLGYLLLVGVAGGLVAALSSASTVLYQLLVWLIGDPTSNVAALHFQNVPDYIGATIVGVIAWFYHHATLDHERVAARSEVQRIYEYLIAAIGLVTGAGGIGILLTALFEALTTPSVLVGGSGSTNTFIAAATLLIVGGPVWWIFWRRIQNRIKISPEIEQASPARKIYLFILFGVGGVAGVIALIVGVFILFDDTFKGNFSGGTVHRARFSLSILLTALLVAGYHWTVYKTERELAPSLQKGLLFVLLVGPRDAELARLISHQTGARVQSWGRLDDSSGFGSTEDLLKILSNVKAESVILLAQSDGVKVIPIDRN